MNMRIQKARHDGQPLVEMDTVELEGLGTELACELLDGGRVAISRKLADVTRVIWSQQSRFGDEAMRTENMQMTGEIVS